MKKILAIAVQALEYLKEGDTNKPHFIKEAEQVIKEFKKKEFIDFIPKIANDMLEQPIDGFEVHPCKIVDEDINLDPKIQAVEQCEPEEAQFWSVYIHYEGGGLDCIADCDTEELANELYAFLSRLVTNFKK
jgi:hypothetical protein